MEALKNIIYNQKSTVFKFANKKNAQVISGSGLFDDVFYCDRFVGVRLSREDAALHYLKYATLDARAPSEKFSGANYWLSHSDVQETGMPSLLHFEKFGRGEGRSYISVVDRGINVEVGGASTAREGCHGKKIALVLHVFYEDYLQLFFELLNEIPFEFDLFVTSPFDSICAVAKRRFSKISSINKLFVKKTENRGRNFGPFLVEFGEELLRYDIIGHAHSKKSLYTGKEQRYWALHTLSGVLNSKQYISKAISLLDRGDIGVVCSERFAGLPFWSEHWLKNAGAAEQLIQDFGLRPTFGFLDYPVGGMFWVKTKVIEPILSRKWSYENFPEELGQIDGTVHHAIERLIGELASHSGNRIAKWSPGCGGFIIDSPTWVKDLESQTISTARASIDASDIVSFDIFDTLVFRDAHSVEFARTLVDQDSNAQKILQGYSYSNIRRQAEVKARSKIEFGSQDIKEIDVAREMEATFGISRVNSYYLLGLEFKYDLELLSPRPTMVSLYDYACSKGKQVFMISDMYYSKEQLKKILKKCGIDFPEDIFVSSELGLRKDHGGMWDFFVGKFGGSKTLLHFGDNIVSDVQNPSERGVSCIYIQTMIEKCKHLGVLKKTPDAKQWIFLKNYVKHFGDSPFFG